MYVLNYKSLSKITATRFERLKTEFLFEKRDPKPHFTDFF